MVKIRSSEITPEHVYLSRRKFMKGIGAIALGSLALSACSSLTTPDTQPTSTAGPDSFLAQPTAHANASADKLTSLDDIMHYNNYYEFTQLKEPVADLAQNFKTRPWSVEVGGLVNNPKTYDIAAMLKQFPQQERIYRLRCVEGWSMVIPWTGFPLAALLKEADPTSKAKYGFYSNTTLFHSF